MVDRVRLPRNVDVLEREIARDHQFGDGSSIIDNADSPLQRDPVLLLLLRSQTLLLEESRGRERRQHAFNQRLLRDVDGLRRQLNALSDPAMGTPAEFPQFRRLPGELRQRIWQLAVQPQLVVHHETINCTSFERGFLRAPAIHEVCFESRAVASCMGSYHRFPMFSNTVTQDLRYSWFWFTPKLDILCLGQIRPTSSVEREATRLFFEYPLGLDPSDLGQDMSPLLPMCGKLAQIERYCKLEVVHIGLRFIIGKELSSAAVAELFNGDPFRLVNIDDELAVQRVCKLLKKEHKNKWSPLTQHMLGAFKRYGYHYNEMLPEIKERLVRRRARAIYANFGHDGTRYISEDGSPNMEVPWVREFLSSFTMQPCILFVPEEPMTNNPVWTELRAERSRFEALDHSWAQSSAFI